MLTVQNAFLIVVYEEIRRGATVALSIVYRPCVQPVHAEGTEILLRLFSAIVVPKFPPSFGTSECNFLTFW